MRLYLLIAKYIAIPPIVTMLMINTIYAMQTNQNTLSPIDEAANAQTKVFAISIVIFILSAIATCGVAIWLFVVSNKYQYAVIQDANAKIELAKAEAAKANEGLAKSNEKIAEANKEIEFAKTEAAKANEQTAKLEKQIIDAKRRQAEAERALLELQARLRFRSLTPEQRNKLSSELLSRPSGRIVVHFLAGNSESEHFAIELAEILAQNHWMVLDCSEIMRMGFGGVLKGLNIQVKDQSNVFAGHLQQAFRCCDIEVPGEVWTEMEADLIRLVVGVKP